jgi:PAS domain S-box-containing protein
MSVSLLLAGLNRIRPVQIRWPRYFFTVAVIALAILVRSSVVPYMGQQSVVVFLAAVLINAWVGGIGPALLTLLLLHLTHGYWFSDPKGLIQPKMASVVSTAAYYFVGIMVGLLSQLRSAAQRRAHEKQREADSQREQLHATLLCMADGVIVTDVQGRITLINPPAERMTGWKMAEAIGRRWSEVLEMNRQDGRDHAESPVERVVNELTIVHETASLTMTSRTGQVFPIAYNAAPVQDRDGSIHGVVLAFRDETERRQSELASKEADRLKDEFLATLSHELRNPLAPILMGLELLELSSDDPQAVRDVCTMLNRQSKHMVRLIDDLLDVSRITRGKLELRCIEADLRDIIRNAVDAARPWLGDAQHSFKLHCPDEPLPLHGDPDRLTQVLTNLLNNAAKYTPSGGKIELTAYRAGCEIIVTVTDEGIGIPADKLDCVFDMFVRIDNGNDSRHFGLGIGLSLVKRLVELHGGKVQARSAGHNRGSTFEIRLPALQSMSLAGDANVGLRCRATSLAKRRVLVVDDNIDALESLSRLVTLMGSDVRRAQDGVDAMEVASTFHPDIGLMDLGMPRLNGYEAARRMRQQPWGRDLTLIAISGWGQEEDRRRSADAGFNCHLVKPIEFASLCDAMDALVDA